MIKNLYITIIAIAAAVLLFAAFINQSSEPMQSNKDLIKFSHSLHSELVECADCHSKVAESISLNDRLLPNHDNCVDCHDVDDDNECATCHIDDNYEPLMQKHSDLIYNHKIHNILGMNCIDCHKGLDKVDYSFESSEVIPSMEICAACHNEVKIATNACESCHISTFSLLPQTHRNVDYTRSHKFQAWEVNANCMMCHDNTTCQDCHVSTTGITEMNLPDDFYPPYQPSNSIDGAKQQALLKVHGDFNYRYSHGIDAKGKTSECQTCHQKETFCVNCHQSEERDFAMAGIVPSSHLVDNFMAIGVGSGGGEHATLARRDIEQCVSCHDVQGADPTCITCHLDTDGIKGTNPKTHSSNYMSGEEGDWHENQGSICYNCHTSASPQSSQTSGFCNYCHGL
ncbi:MAG: cytochrome C [Ignavibacteria bacterium RBG_16_36_9]|nr:MAG: cytochrome C [Ignavibacteria bacterium RBG_16_36_9]